MASRSLVEPWSVLLSPHVAAVLEHWLDLDRFRKDVRGRNPEVDEALTALHVAATYHRDQRRSEITSAHPGSGVAPAPEPAASSTVMSCSKVAEVAGCTARGVRAAAIAEQLVGTKDDRGYWSFTTEDVAAWLAARPREAA